VTTSEALAFAMMCVKAMKKQAVANEESFNQDVVIPAIQDMERELGILPSVVDPIEGIVLEEERPDIKFNQALDVLENAYNEFENFESEHGEEETWSPQPADYSE
jgi:hypothetical protein